MKFLALILLVATPAIAAEPPFFGELAAHYAPVIYQETGKTPKADALTRVDYDGDLDGSDNWDNLPNFPVPGYVYYSVIESRTHYFITYGFFHARDYSHVCIPIFCHENDFEGAILTIKKVRSSRFGEIILLETLAHFEIKSSFHPATVMDPITGEQRVAIFIQRMGHGVYPKKPTQKIDPAHNLLYAYAGTADDPGDEPFGNVRYDLLPIKAELWDRDDLVGPHGLWAELKPYHGKRFSWPAIPFDFNGSKFMGMDKPQPPWSWGSPLGFSTGEWFLDPALVVARHKEIDLNSFSLEYLYNPFMP